MKKTLKKSLLLCMLLSFLFALSGCGEKEALYFDVDRDSMIKITKDIIQTYRQTNEIQQDYFLHDGNELEKTAVNGFLAAESTDHVGSYIGLKDDSTIEIKNGANGKVNCSVYCHYEHRDVKVTVSYTQNRKYELEKQLYYQQLSAQAQQYGMDIGQFVMQMYGNNPDYDFTSVDAFLDSFLWVNNKESLYIPQECEVSAVYSKKELIGQGGKNTIIGMGVVFCVLIFISFIISLLKYLPLLFDAEMRKQKAEKKAAEEAAKKKTEATIIANKNEPEVKKEVQSTENKDENLVNDAELVAVITAAIYAATGDVVRGTAYTASNDKLVVRSIRRVRK